MSETNKTNVRPEESNIASNPEQAVNAATTKLTAELSNEPVEETTVEFPVKDEESANAGSKPATRQEIIERIQEIAAGDDVLNCKAEAEALKVQFYKLRTIEIDAERKTFVAEGGEENLFIPKPDELEEPFKAAMNQIKEKRTAWLKAQEEEMQANYETKLTMLDELKKLVESAGQESPDVNAFRTVQNRWKEIKNIPQDEIKISSFLNKKADVINNL